MIEVEQKLKKRVESGELDMPVLPAVGAQVLELSRHQDSDAKQLATLIQNDQALATHVMKVANSAAFTSIGNIQTLQQAIAKLGMQQIGQMAIAVTVGQSVYKADPATTDIMARLWRHSLACAAWAKEIARICRINTEVVFLSGLLHQIGKPIALHTIASSLTKHETLPDTPHLLRLMDEHQKVIGLSLARRWKLPEPVIESINYIDDFFAAPSARMEVMVVNAARILADLTIDNSGVNSDDNHVGLQAMDDQVFTELNLYQEDKEALLAKQASVNELLANMVL